VAGLQASATTEKMDAHLLSISAFLLLLVSLLCFDRISPFFRSFLSSFALFSFFVLAGAQ
jgi:hypothetical protein